MTETIEVPVELIQAGDLDAIRELLPKPNLFGRWATHASLGRGIIISVHPDQDDLVRFAYEKENRIGGTDYIWADLEDLTLDPVELVTLKDFETAPEGTVVADSQSNAFQNTEADTWESVNDMLTDKNMAVSAPWKILRWGWGK